MGEILGIGMSHFPGMRQPGGGATNLERMLQRPDIPPEWKEPKNWPAAMQAQQEETERVRREMDALRKQLHQRYSERRDRLAKVQTGVRRAARNRRDYWAFDRVRPRASLCANPTCGTRARLNPGSRSNHQRR